MRVPNWYEDKGHPAYWTLKAFFTRVLVANRRFIGLAAALVIVIILMYTTS